MSKYYAAMFDCKKSGQRTVIKHYDTEAAVKTGKEGMRQRGCRVVDVWTIQQTTLEGRRRRRAAGRRAKR